MIRIEEISLGLQEDEGALGRSIAAILGLGSGTPVKYSVVKRAVDSRNKRNICFVYSVDVHLENEDMILEALEGLTGDEAKKMRRHRVRRQEPYTYVSPCARLETVAHCPVVVGMGPSGLFAALLLARAGLKPLVVERGRDVDSRVRDVETFFSGRKLDPESNVQFGEGGAGTFSDGKLNTLIKDSRTGFVFKELIAAGAPGEIAWDAKPHIGTDRLRDVVKNMRREIISCGGEIHFNTCLKDIVVKDGEISSVILSGLGEVATNDLVLATGHSARDTYEMLHERGVEIKAKPFAIGVRIEHSAEMINRAQYRDFHNHPKLPTARYKLVAHLPEDRSVYTFCMCPGGFVVAAASEENQVVVNGMSEFARDAENSNSALLVQVTPEDFGSDSPIAGIEFQRVWEKKAFVAGGSDYSAPAQLVGDFLKNRPSRKPADIDPSYRPGVKFTSLDGVLPGFVLESLRKALPVLGRKVRGFDHPGAVLTGVETRSSSPVKLPRDENFQSSFRGIYPAGEGAGYAGGIISSAVDGLRVAEAVINRYA